VPSINNCGVDFFIDIFSVTNYKLIKSQEKSCDGKEMPRKPRDFQIGEIYHIIKRGSDGRDIFLTKKDYSRFILTLEFFNSKQKNDLWRTFFNKEKERGNVSKNKKKISQEKQQIGLKSKIYKKRIEKNKEERIVDFMAFALMPNHYHLLLREIKKGGISLFMKKIGGYSIYFNQQHKRKGTLFQSRYKAVPIETDEQLSIVFSYIHTNPISLWEPEWKEGKIKDWEPLFEKLHQYPHSSFLDYIGKRNHPSVTSRGFLLDFFGGTKKCKENVENWIKLSTGDRQSSKNDEGQTPQRS
jgi:putative transposase